MVERATDTVVYLLKFKRSSSHGNMTKVRSDLAFA